MANIDEILLQWDYETKEQEINPTKKRAKKIRSLENEYLELDK